MSHTGETPEQEPSTVRLAHITDSHLGRQPYGSERRRLDFHDAFRNAVDRAIEAAVDAVLFTGDLTHSDRPTEDLPDIVGDALDRLDSAGIEFCYILGNHDMHDGRPQAWKVTLDRLQPVTHLSRTPYYIGDIALYGVDFHEADWWREELPSFEPAPAAETRVLCLHQLFEEIPDHYGGELSLQELTAGTDIEFDMVFSGHCHRCRVGMVDGTQVFFDGAIERTTRAYRDEAPTIHIYTIDGEDVSRSTCELDVRPFVEFTLVPGNAFEPETISADVDEAATRIEDAVVTVTVPSGFDAAEIEALFDRHDPLDVAVFESTIEFPEHIPPGLYCGPPEDLRNYREEPPAREKSVRLLHLGELYIGRQKLDGRRREDFLKAFHTACEIALEEDVDAIVQSGGLFGTEYVPDEDFEIVRTILNHVTDAGVDVMHVPTGQVAESNEYEQLVDEGLITRLDTTPSRCRGFDFVGFRLEDDVELAATDGATQTTCAVGHVRVAPPLAERRAELSLDSLLDSFTGTPAAVLLGGSITPATESREGTLVSYTGPAERLFGLYSFENDDPAPPCEVSLIEVGPDSVTREQVSLNPRPYTTVTVSMDPGDDLSVVLERVNEHEIEDVIVLIRLNGGREDSPVVDDVAILDALETQAHLVHVWDKREIRTEK